MDFTCCFLNCKNLWPEDTASNSRELHPDAVAAKLANLAGTLREAAGGRSPDLVGLCEVGSELMGKRLGEALSPHTYGSIWAQDPPRGYTGLMILYNKEAFARGQAARIDEDTTGEEGRPKSLAGLLHCRKNPSGRVWLVVCHWHSPLSGEEAATSRQNLWGDFNRFYKRDGRVEADAVIVVGDFNCEPGDKPIVSQPDNVVSTTRERRIALAHTQDGLRFYNPMWRHMVEPHCADTVPVDRQGVWPPLGTYRKSPGSPWKMLDQLLLSPALLHGPHFHFRESTLRIIQPRGGCSDHCAIGVAFEIKEIGNA